MLLESDVTIAYRDTALPGLTTLLNPVAFVDTLRRALPGLVLESATPVYISYKPSKEYLIGYRLTVNGEPVYINAKTYSQDRATRKLSKARRNPGVAGPLGTGRLALDEIATVVSVYPNDDKINTLSLLANDQSQAQVLRELLPERPDLWQGTLHHLKYKPERRAVLRLDCGGEPHAVLKLYKSSGYDTARQIYQRFTSRGAFRVAPDVGRSDHHQTLSFGWLAGRLLSKAMKDPGFSPSELQPVGAALAELHAQDGDGLPRQTGADIARDLMTAASTLGVLVPAIATRIQTLVQRLAVCLSNIARCDRPIHGDFCAQQVLIDGDWAAIIDFDQAKQGDPATDLGMFIANMERNVIRGRLMAERVDTLKADLLKGYAGASGKPIVPHLNIFVAALLLRHAEKFFRHRSPDWPQLIETTVARTEAIFEEAW